MEKDVKSRIQAIVHRSATFGDRSDNTDDDIRVAYGIDSLTWIIVLRDIESEFEIELSESAFDQIDLYSIDGIAAVVRQLINE